MGEEETLLRVTALGRHVDEQLREERVLSPPPAPPQSMGTHAAGCVTTTCSGLSPAVCSDRSVHQRVG